MLEFRPPRCSPGGWWRAGVALAWSVGLVWMPLAGSTPAHGQALAALSHEAKAEMLFNATKFIQWPGRSFTDAEGNFVFAILGQDTLAEALATSLSGKTIAGRPVFIRFVRRIQDLDGSQIAYIAQSEERRLAETLRALQGRSTLTVGDFHSFIGQGGMMDFAQETDHLRFQIHRERAERAGLKISSRLLVIARLVEQEN